MVERMSSQIELVGSKAETSPRHCIIIPGIQATKKGMFGPLGIHQAFVAQYGEKNVTTFSSSISTDKPNPAHFDEIADAIMTHAKRGPVDVAMFSLGATEFALPVYKRILKKDENFFDDPQVQSNLQFYIKSASGFSKGIGRIIYPMEFVRLLRDVGLDTVYAFPPDDMTSSEINSLYPKRPNNKFGDNTVPFIEHENVRTNAAFLTQAEKEAKEQADAKLRLAKSQMQYRRARKIIRSRKKILGAPLQAVYEGTVDGRNVKKSIKPKEIRGAALLVRALGSKPEKRMKKLHEKGYSVYNIVSGLERLVTVKQVGKMYKDKEEAKQYIKVLESSTHTGDALQAGILARTIYELGAQKTA